MTSRLGTVLAPVTGQSQRALPMSNGSRVGARHPRKIFPMGYSLGWKPWVLPGSIPLECDCRAHCGELIAAVAHGHAQRSKKADTSKFPTCAASRTTASVEGPPS